LTVKPVIGTAITYDDLHQLRMTGCFQAIQTAVVSRCHQIASRWYAPPMTTRVTPVTGSYPGGADGSFSGTTRTLIFMPLSLQAASSRRRSRSYFVLIMQPPSSHAAGKCVRTPECGLGYPCSEVPPLSSHS